MSGHWLLTLPYYNLCSLCNYDLHYCGGCDRDLSHGEVVCDACKRLYSEEAAIVEEIYRRDS